MNKTFIIASVFLLLAAGAFATPFVTVDKNVSICNKTGCDNSTKVRQGLLNLHDDLTVGIRSITVHNLPAQTRNGTLVRSTHTADGKVDLYVKGMNASDYRSEVGRNIGYYYTLQQENEMQFWQAEAARKYPLPSWAPRPGACNMGVRMTTSTGKVVCVRPHRGK